MKKHVTKSKRTLRAFEVVRSCLCLDERWHILYSVNSLHKYTDTWFLQLFYQLCNENLYLNGIIVISIHIIPSQRPLSRRRYVPSVITIIRNHLRLSTSVLQSHNFYYRTEWFVSLLSSHCIYYRELWSV